MYTAIADIRLVKRIITTNEDLKKESKDVVVNDNTLKALIAIHELPAYQGQFNKRKFKLKQIIDIIKLKQRQTYRIIRNLETLGLIELELDKSDNWYCTIK
jgi:DNA-binding MarR family transcriptional regulator